MKDTKRITIESEEYGTLNFSGVEEAREYIVTFKNSGGEPGRIAQKMEQYLQENYSNAR